MKFKNYFFLLLLAIFSFSTNAQEVSPNVPTQATSVKLITPIHVTSIASRLNELVVSEDVTPREAQDKRSLGNTVIIGKDRQTQDDYFVRNKHEAEQSVRVASPSLVFDAYSSSSSPTDPDMAVGPNHVVITYNTRVVIYDKSGNILAGPFSPNPAIFPASGCCDLTASYDNLADRWVLTFLGPSQSIAVSDGPDPLTAGWNIYNLSFNDYNKLSIWSDGYYLTQNIGGTNRVHALERDEMLAGNPAQIIGFPLPGMITQGFWSPQFFDVSDGNMPAAGGATVVFLQDDAFGGVSNDHVKLWTIDMDWGAGSGTISAATQLPATPFISVFDGGSFANLPQPGGGALIDAVQNTVMNQARFKKFPTYNAAIFNFVIDTDASAGKLAGIRWYEVRQDDDNMPWTVYQEGTYTSPDGKHAWMASMNWDSNGNIAMGYSAMAGPTTPNPTDFRVGSYYTGRFDGDPLGVMTAAEEVIAVSTANVPNTRYCDYNKLELDTDGTTFWFLDEYINGGRKGVVGVFQLAPPQANDLGITAITDPNTGVLGATEDIVVNIRNFGSNDITNPQVQYILDGGAPVVENFSGTITAGASASYTFTATANLSTPATYLIAAKTNLAGDTNTGNDETTKMVISTSGPLYCMPQALLGCNIDGIKMFVLNTISADDGGDTCNTEPASSPQGYADRTALSTDLNNAAGSNEYILQAQQNWPGGVGVEGFSVWIDFDDSGTFEVSERLISGELFNAFGVLEPFTLTIPVNSALGPHRLRAKAIDTSAGGNILDPCSDFDYGEVQDYTVNITGLVGFEDFAISQAELIVLSLDNNQFDISLVTSFDDIASISIYNMLGQKLAFNNLEKQGDRYNYQLDMSYASAGIYLVKMGDQASNTYKTAKIIVK
jgi:hypothetical protein